MVQRAANSRVWARTNVEMISGGGIVTNVHTYTELATGMHYTNSLGQWLESKEQIDILPQGGAAATQGQHKVYFPSDIYDGVLEVVTPDGKHLQSRPIGVSYDDGSNCVWIGTLKHSSGLLLSSNQVIYPDAFTGLNADILCRYRRGGFECDVVFRKRPASPATYGLAPETSRLQLFTEFFNTQDPQQIPSVQDEWFGLQDHNLKFGRLTMAHGKAFAIDSSGRSAKTRAPVFKTWAHLDNRTFLIEELPLDYIAPDLETLPAATNSLSLTTAVGPKFASAKRVFPAERTPAFATNQIQVASVDFEKQAGFVLDYVEVSGSLGDYTFAADTTYRFRPGAV